MISRNAGKDESAKSSSPLSIEMYWFPLLWGKFEKVVTCEMFLLSSDYDKSLNKILMCKMFILHCALMKVAEPL